MNSPDNSDNTRSWRAIYTPKLPFAFESQLASTITILITPTTGASYKYFFKFDSAFIRQAGLGCKWLGNLASHREGYHFPSSVRMSCRCDDNFTTNYAPSHSSPLDNVALDEVEDFTPVRAELSCPHSSYLTLRQIELYPLFNKLSFNDFITECFWIYASIYSDETTGQGSCWWMSDSRWEKKAFRSQCSPRPHRLSTCQHSAETSSDCIQTLTQSHKDHTALMIVYVQHTAEVIINNRMLVETA